MIGTIEKSTPPDGWPLVKGDYVVGDRRGCVAVVTCGSDFGNRLVAAGAAISGRLMTSNIGVELIVANVVSNPNIRYLIVAGSEVAGHWPGDAISCLCKYGLVGGRIANARGPMPYVENVGGEAVERFRRQAKLIEMIDVAEEGRIVEAVRNAVSSDPGAYPGGPLIVGLKSGGVLESTAMWLRMKGRH